MVTEVSIKDATGRAVSRIAAGTAEPDKVADWVEGLTPQYLMCRDISHDWGAYTASWSEEDKAFRRTLRCKRCKTTKSQWINANGYIVDNGTTYGYPEGYLVPHGVGRLYGDGRAALRLASLLRVIEG